MTARTTCADCGEELWGAAERYGVCGMCQSADDPDDDCEFCGGALGCCSCDDDDEDADGDTPDWQDVDYDPPFQGDEA